MELLIANLFFFFAAALDFNINQVSLIIQVL